MEQQPAAKRSRKKIDCEKRGGTSIQFDVSGERQPISFVGDQDLWSVIMSPEQQRALQVLVDRLVKEVGVTEVQARELITLLGSDWSSLVREARLLSKRRW